MVYYMSDGRGGTLGPYTMEQLRYMGVTRDTMIWREGLDGWYKAQQLPDLDPLFANRVMDSESAAAQFGEPYNKPPQTLVLAIVSCVIFFPLGIPAIIRATKVDSLWEQGDNLGAWYMWHQSRKYARRAIVTGICIAAGIVTLYIMTYMIMFGTLMFM